MYGIQYSPILAVPPFEPSSPLTERCINTPPPKTFDRFFYAHSPCQMSTLPSLPHHIPENDADDEQSSPPSLDFLSSPVRSQRVEASPLSGRRRDERLTRRLTPVNPFRKSSDERIAKRRQQFLNKVEDQRSEQRWTARGDQILQDDYITETRAWQNERSQSAPPFEADDSDLENDIGELAFAGRAASVGREVMGAYPEISTSQQPPRGQPPEQREMEELDEYLAAEEAEVKELLETVDNYQELEQMEVLEDDLIFRHANTERAASVHNQKPRATVPPLACSEHIDMMTDGNNIIDPPLSCLQCYPRPASPTFSNEDEEFERLLLELDDGFEKMDLS